QSSAFASTSAKVSPGEITSATKSGAPGQYLSVRPTASARSEAMNAASGARTVSGLRVKRKPVSAAKVTPAPLSRAWTNNHPALRRGNAAMFRSGREHHPKLSSDELMPHPIVRKAPQLLRGTRTRPDCHGHRLAPPRGHPKGQRTALTAASDSLTASRSKVP